MDQARTHPPQPTRTTPRRAAPGGPDAVARFAAQWRHQRPGLDVDPMLVVGRIFRLAHLMDAALRPPFAAAALHGGDFDVLSALRRSGTPIRPHALSASLLVTTGAITKRLDRLEAAGLIERQESAQDGRGKLVLLTAAGLELTDRLIEQHLANQRHLLSPLTPHERQTLQSLLGRLTADLEEADLEEPV